MTKRLAGAHVLSVKQFDRELLDDVFAVARNMRVLVRSVGTADLLKGRVLTNLFYESSTRTSSSFAAAILRLGGSVVPINDVNYSSVTKGETLEDTVRTLEAYGDALVLRHPELGAAARAAAVATKPVINAGDGPGEHPTQALLDLFTILTEKLGGDPGAGSSAKCLGGLRVALVGDLRHGRTVHSLSRLLALYGGDTSNLAAGIPVGEIGRPEDFGQVVAFLCSEQARHITGTALPVAGGADRGLL